MGQQKHPYRNLIPKIAELLTADPGVTDIFDTNIHQGLEPDEYNDANTITPFINIFPEVREVENAYAHRRDGAVIVNVDIVYNRDITDNLKKYDGVFEVERVLSDDANKSFAFTVDSAKLDNETPFVEVPAIDLTGEKQLLGIAFKYIYYQKKPSS